MILEIITTHKSPKIFLTYKSGDIGTFYCTSDVFAAKPDIVVFKNIYTDIEVSTIIKFPPSKIKAGLQKGAFIFDAEVIDFIIKGI